MYGVALHRCSCRDPLTPPIQDVVFSTGWFRYAPTHITCPSLATVATVASCSSFGARSCNQNQQLISEVTPGRHRYGAYLHGSICGYAKAQLGQPYNSKVFHDTNSHNIIELYLEYNALQRSTLRASRAKCAFSSRTVAITSISLHRPRF